MKNFISVNSSKEQRRKLAKNQLKVLIKTLVKCYENIVA